MSKAGWSLRSPRSKYPAGVGLGEAGIREQLPLSLARILSGLPTTPSAFPLEPPIFDLLTAVHTAPRDSSCPGRPACLSAPHLQGLEANTQSVIDFHATRDWFCAF